MPVSSRTQRYGSPAGGATSRMQQGVAPPVKHAPASAMPNLSRAPSLHSLLRGQSPTVGGARYGSPSRRAMSSGPGRVPREGLSSPQTPSAVGMSTPVSPRLGLVRQASCMSHLSRASPSSPRFTPMQLSRKNSAASSTTLRTTSLGETVGHSDDGISTPVTRKFTPARAPSPLSHTYTPGDQRRRALSASATRRGTTQQMPASDLPSLASSTTSLLKGLLDSTKSPLSPHTVHKTPMSPRTAQTPFKPASTPSWRDTLRVVCTESPPVPSLHNTSHGALPGPSTPLTPATPAIGRSEGGRKVPAHISNMVCSWTAHGQEDQAKYGPDGYMRLKKGVVLDGRYHVVSKLGWGEFATVWLCWDQESMRRKLTTSTSQFVAIKVSKCAQHVSNAAREEANLLKYIGRHAQGGGAHSLAKVLGVFSQQGEYGSHVCMVFPVLGQNILCLVEQAHRHRNKIRGISNPSLCPKRLPEDLAFVKSCLRASLRGLYELAKHNIVHTDLKPENVLLTTVSQKARVDMREWQDAVAKLRGTEWEPERLVSTADVLPNSERESSYIRISDFGLSSLLDPNAKAHGIGTHARRLQCREPGSATNPLGVILQTREYRAPEVLFGNVITPTTDVWSLGCMAFELVTGTFLMDPKKDPKRRQKPEDEINCDHICMMQQLLGQVPLHVAKGGGKHLYKYFDESGRFIQQEKADKYFQPRHLKQELMYFLEEEDAGHLASFIVECLGSFDATKRATAEQMLKHPFLHR